MALDLLHGHEKMAMIEKPVEKRATETRHGIANVVSEVSGSSPSQTILQLMNTTHGVPQVSTYTTLADPPAEIPPPDPAPGPSSEAPRPLTATVVGRPKTRRYLTAIETENISVRNHSQKKRNIYRSRERKYLLYILEPHRICLRRSEK